MDAAPAERKCFSQLFDVIVHDPFISLEVISPQPDQKLIPRKNAVRILKEKDEQFVFLRRERTCFSADPHGAYAH